MSRHRLPLRRGGRALRRRLPLACDLDLPDLIHDDHHRPRRRPSSCCDADGTAFAAYRYDAWGSRGFAAYRYDAVRAVRQLRDRDLDAKDDLDHHSTLAGQIAGRQVLRYAAYAYDAESALDYCSARYYDPATRPWTTGDPAKADGEESAYQYCGGGLWGRLHRTEDMGREMVGRLL